MRKHFIVGLLLCFGLLGAMAQGPVVSIAEKTHNFGTIAEEGGKVTHTFEITNTGDADLLLTNVQASCGCTTPKWTKEPIAPNGKANITVTYNPKGRPGAFNKSVTVTNNSSEGRIVLYIKGDVTPKAKEEIK